MSTYDINKIQLPNGDTCNLKDSNAVHKTDYADYYEAGVVKVSSDNGVYLDNNKFLAISGATPEIIKAGIHDFRPIIPKNQNYAAFYGLAKAAGVDMASSNNAIGTYTDEAKGAIQNMLGINNMIAPIQTNTLAIQAYSINDLFWYNGKLYKATAAIAQNGNIVIGTNCIETKLTDNYISKSIGTTAGDMIYYSGNTTPSRLEIGNQGQVLKVNSNGLPQWKNENVAEYKTLTDQTVATFNDGVQNSILKSYSVKIEPKQDLHGYDHPWVGGCGKNLCPVNTITGKSAIANVTCNIPAGSYIISYSSSDIHQLSFRFYYTQGNNSDSITKLANPGDTITFSKDVVSMNVIISPVDSDTITINNIQIEAGSAATSFEPYSNICPIAGWTGAKVTRTGKNLWSLNDTYTASGYSWVINQEPMFLRSGIYTFSADVNIISDTIVLFGWYADGTRIEIARLGSSPIRQSVTKVIENDIVAFSMVFNQAGTISDIQLESASTATSYEPYTGQTVDVQFPAEAGTVYGGTLTMNEDGSGTLVVDKVNLDLGTLTWNKDEESFNRFYCTDMPMSQAGDGNNARTVYVISDRYDGKYNSEPYNSTWNGVIYFGNIVRIYIHDNRFTDATSFASAINGSHIVYSVSPTTYNLTATQLQILFDTNHIWADAGNITITYPTNLKGYIDNINNRCIKKSQQAQAVFYGLAASAGDNTQKSSNNAIGIYTDEAKAYILHMLGLDEIIGNYELDEYADKNYSVDQLFMMKGKLYKATSFIPQGGSIVPNTNCIQTTILENLINQAE